MASYKTMGTRAALACAAVVALTLGGCGEVAGAPAESPESAKPKRDPTDLSSVTDGEIKGDDGDTKADQASAKPASEDEGTAEPKGGASADQPKGGADTDAGKPKNSATESADDEGSRNETVIAKYVGAQRQPVRDCYDRELKKKPGLKGKLVIHFEIDPEGKVTKAELNEKRSEIKDPDLVACAVKVIRGIKFPASSKGMVTESNYPYEFKPPR
jgi:outer membrane biosynthesis protein TonB